MMIQTQVQAGSVCQDQILVDGSKDQPGITEQNLDKKNSLFLCTLNGQRSVIFTSGGT